MMMRKGDIILGISKKVIDGIIAGILISLGGAAFLACYDADIPYTKYVGAVLFSVALLCICMRGYALYTGKIGFTVKNHSKDDISALLLCLLGNAVGTVAFGYLIGWVFPEIKATALTLCTAKLSQGYGFGLLRAVLCGILVYLAVDIYRNSKSTLGILLCIPAFVISGYEHSVADIFYFAASGIASGEAFLYILMIIIGNSLGSLLIPLLQLIRPCGGRGAEGGKVTQEGNQTQGGSKITQEGNGTQDEVITQVGNGTQGGSIAQEGNGTQDDGIAQSGEQSRDGK